MSRSDHIAANKPIMIHNQSHLLWMIFSGGDRQTRSSSLDVVVVGGWWSVFEEVEEQVGATPKNRRPSKFSARDLELDTARVTRSWGFGAFVGRYIKSESIISSSLEFDSSF